MKKAIVMVLLILLSMIPTISGMEAGVEQPIRMVDSNNYNVTLSFNVTREVNGSVIPAPNCEIWMWVYFSSLWQLPTLIGITNETGMYPTNENYSGYRVWEGNDIKIKIIHAWYGSWESGAISITKNTPNPLHFDVKLNKNKSKSTETNGVVTYKKTPFIVMGRHNTVENQFDIELRVKDRQLVYGNLWVYKANRHDNYNLIIHIGRDNVYRCNEMILHIYNMIGFLVVTEERIFCIGYAGRIVVE